jgi:hypothetical protein
MNDKGDIVLFARGGGSQPCRVKGEKHDLPFVALALVALVEVYLFCGFHWDRWYKSLLPFPRPQAQTGQGLVVRCDGLGYYAWLRSLIADGDWSFDNEFDEYNVIGDAVPSPADRTPIGRRANPWSVGPACVWSLAIIPGHIVVKSLQNFGFAWPADGYSLPYQLLVGLTSLGISIIGIGFMYGVCRHFAEPRRAALATGLLTLGTTVVYYGAIEVSMAHGIGTTVVACFVWYWLTTYGSASPRRWFALGLLAGAVALVRWQLATLVVLPAGEAVLALLSARSRMCDQGAVMERAARYTAAVPLADSEMGIAAELDRTARNAAIFAASALLAFVPQLIAWQVVYGSHWPSPIAVSHNWLRPSFWQVLFSRDRSFFSWTPLVFIALIGFFVGRERSGKAFLLIVAFALQVYVLASLWGTGVYLGVAYGFRHLTECVVVLAPGLALLLQRIPNRVLPWFALLGSSLALWNLLLVAQYRYGILPPDSGADFSTLLHGALRLIERKRILLLGQALLAPVALWLLVGRNENTFVGNMAWLGRWTLVFLGRMSYHTTCIGREGDRSLG